MSSCVALLARREHSQLELLRKLQVKGFEKDQIQQVLDDLTGKNLQSDIRFAESYTRARANKGFGPKRIELELKERGVEMGLSQFDDETPDWQQNLEQLHRKKYGTNKPKDRKEYAQRMRFFQHKGYSFEMINRLLNDLP